MFIDVWRNPFKIVIFLWLSASDDRKRWTLNEARFCMCVREYLIDTLDKKSLLVWNRYSGSLVRKQSFAPHNSINSHTPILPAVVQYIQWIKSLLKFFVNWSCMMCVCVWCIACQVKFTPFHLWIVGFQVVLVLLLLLLLLLGCAQRITYICSFELCSLNGIIIISNE